MRRSLAASTRAGLVLGLALLASCTEEDSGDEPLPGDPSFVRDPKLDVDNRSAHDELRSHNAGLNCMTCHQPHGPGKGLFSVGVTVFDADKRIVPNPVLELYTAPPASGVSPAFTLQGDLRGNIYTTDPLPFLDNGLFVVVRSKDGSLRNNMPFPVESGACNLCHRGGAEVTLLPLGGR
jgi:hypothetical protein